MNTIRIILTGNLVWALIFTTFTVMSFIPGLNDSYHLQGLLAGILIIPFAALGAAIYYKKGDKSNGFIIGSIMVGTALILDAMITVPVVEIPNGGSYLEFYTNPLLWILVVETIFSVYFYWRLKVKSDLHN